MKLTKLLLATFTILVMIMAAYPTASADLTLNEAIPDVVMNEDEVALNEINLNEHFSDGPSELSFSSVSTDNKIQVTLHEDGGVDFAAPDNWFGVEKVTFIASDGEQQVSDTILVTVIATNDNPILVRPLLDSLHFFEDGSLEDALDLNAHFKDIDSTLSFSYTSENIKARIDENGHVDFYAPRDWFGTEEVTFIAWDGEEDLSDTVEITVEPVNDAPSCELGIASLNLRTAGSEKTLDLSEIFTDVDDEELTYEITGNNRIFTQINSQKNQLKITAPDGWTGEEVLTLTATDSSGGTSSMQIVVLVTKGANTYSQLFYLVGLVLAVAITGTRLHFAGRKRSIKSPVHLNSYRHYKGD